MKTAIPRDPGQSALSAFRADFPAGGLPPAQEDIDCIAIATLLRHAATSVSVAGRERCLREAIKLANLSLDDTLRSEPAGYDPLGSRSRTDPLRKVAYRSWRAGHCTIADHMAESLIAVTPPGTIHTGRILILRARTALYRGDVELSKDLVRRLHRLGRALDDPELIHNAALWDALIAWHLGNMQEATRISRRVLRVIDQQKHGAIAIGPLTVISTHAALKREFDVAVRHAWMAYNLPGLRAYQIGVVLVNIGQMLVDAGFPAAARAAHAALLNRKQRMSGIALAALGGYALASADLDDSPSVEWAVTQTMAYAKSRVTPREVADALLECSQALRIVGKVARAETLRRRALALASRYGFNDIVYLAEQGTMRNPAPRRMPMTAPPSELVTEIARLEPSERPLLLTHAE